MSLYWCFCLISELRCQWILHSVLDSENLRHDKVVCFKSRKRGGRGGGGEGGRADIQTRERAKRMRGGVGEKEKYDAYLLSQLLKYR